MNDEKNAIFVDAKGDSWHIAITFGDILRVKHHVKGSDGKPLDLCYIAETGDFRQVTDHIEIICQCIYWLIQPDIETCLGLTGMAAMEEFYSRIDSNTITEMTKAWYEAILNFTPYPVVQSTMLAAGKIKTQKELMIAIEILAGRLIESMNTPEFSDSTQEDLHTANS